MKYTMTRKINLKRFFPEMAYETVDFAVLEADSKEEATKELTTWIDEWLKTKHKEVNDKRTAEEKFEDSLDDTPEPTRSKNEDKKIIKGSLIAKERNK